MSVTPALDIQVAALKVVSEYTSERYEEARAALVDEMARGDRRTSRDPRDDAKLASHTLTDPKPVVRVNEPELTPWFAEKYPELTETVTEVIATEKQIADLLFEHAPHLLRRRTRIKRDALIEFKAACVALGCVMGPGGEAEVPGVQVDRPDPVLAVRLTEDARARVLALVRSGHLQFDGTAPLLLEESS